MATYGKIQFFDESISASKLIISYSEQMESVEGEMGCMCLNLRLGGIYMFVGQEADGDDVINHWISISSMPSPISVIDARYEVGVITPTNLEYAVRSVVPKVIKLDSHKYEYNLFDETAEYGEQCSNYVVSPTTSYLQFDLPNINDDEDNLLEHEINVEVDFTGFTRFPSGDSGNAYAWLKDTYVIFTDDENPVEGSTNVYTASDLSNSNRLGTVYKYDSLHDEILPEMTVEFWNYRSGRVSQVTELEISCGDLVNYVCRWSHNRGKWCVMPVLMAKHDEEGSMPEIQ